MGADFAVKSRAQANPGTDSAKQMQVKHWLHLMLANFCQNAVPSVACLERQGATVVFSL